MFMGKSGLWDCSGFSDWKLCVEETIKILEASWPPREASAPHANVDWDKKRLVDGTVDGIGPTPVRPSSILNLSTHWQTNAFYHALLTKYKDNENMPSSLRTPSSLPKKEIFWGFWSLPPPLCKVGQLKRRSELALILLSLASALIFNNFTQWNNWRAYFDTQSTILYLFYLLNIFTLHNY